MRCSLLSVLQEAAKGRAVPGSCLKLAIVSVQLLLMWSLRNLEEQSSSPSSTAMTALSKAVASFGGQLDAIGAAEDDEDVQRTIQRTQSNLFLVFSLRKLKVRAPAMHRDSDSPCKLPDQDSRYLCRSIRPCSDGPRQNASLWV